MSFWVGVMKGRGNFRRVILYYLLALSTLLVTANGHARAEAAYSSEDVIRFFANQANLGENRSLCIGTKDECKWDDAPTSGQPTAPPKGFNLTVTFEFGSSSLTNDAKINLDQFALALKDDRLSRATFLLEGHTDAVGSEAANRLLSEQRARSVARYLVSQGVDLTKLEMVGHGESQLARPEVPDHNDNRRVEAKIIFQ